MRVLLTVLIMIGSVGAASGQTTNVRPATTLRSPAQITQIDRDQLVDGQVQQLRAQVRGLQGDVKTLQAQLTDLNARTVTFQCTSQSTGRNSKNIPYDCSPYICAPETGQCKTQCVTSADCQLGYVCDIPSRICVTGR